MPALEGMKSVLLTCCEAYLQSQAGLEALLLLHVAVGGNLDLNLCGTTFLWQHPLVAWAVLLLRSRFLWSNILQKSSIVGTCSVCVKHMWLYVTLIS